MTETVHELLKEALLKKSSEKSGAIGRDHKYFVCNSADEVDALAGHTFDSSQETIIVVMSKKLAAEVSATLLCDGEEDSEHLGQAIHKMLR